jgi:hypothetical protein
MARKQRYAVSRRSVGEPVASKDQTRAPNPRTVRANENLGSLMRKIAVGGSSDDIATGTGWSAYPHGPALHNAARRNFGRLRNRLTNEKNKMNPSITTALRK